MPNYALAWESNKTQYIFSGGGGITLQQIYMSAHESKKNAFIICNDVLAQLRSSK